MKNGASGCVLLKRAGTNFKMASAQAVVLRPHFECNKWNLLFASRSIGNLFKTSDSTRIKVTVCIIMFHLKTLPNLQIPTSVPSPDKIIKIYGAITIEDIKER